MSSVIETNINEARYNWYAAGNREPDAILINPKDFYDFIDYINKMMLVTSSLAKDGRYKYSGLDLIPSNYIEQSEIRVAKTKP